MKIFIANVPHQLEEKELEDLLSTYGNVRSVKLLTDKETGKRKGFGFIEMENEEQGQNVIAHLNGKEIKGRKIALARAVEKASDSSPRTSGRPRHTNYVREERGFGSEIDGNKW